MVVDIPKRAHEAFCIRKNMNSVSIVHTASNALKVVLQNKTVRDQLLADKTRIGETVRCSVRDDVYEMARELSKASDMPLRVLIYRAMDLAITINACGLGDI